MSRSLHKTDFDRLGFAFIHSGFVAFSGYVRWNFLRICCCPLVYYIKSCNYVDRSYRSIKESLQSLLY